MATKKSKAKKRTDGRKRTMASLARTKKRKKVVTAHEDIDQKGMNEDLSNTSAAPDEVPAGEQK